MRTNALATTSQRRDCARTEQVAREWLVKFAEICQKPITTALANIWAEQLGDIPPDLLNRACDQLAKTWTSGFLPTPGNVRALIAQADGGRVTLEAEAAWDKYLAHVKRFFHPDIGWNRQAPQLAAIVDHCARAAGGPHWIESCPEPELLWCRKRFLEAYALVHETGPVEHLLGDGEAKQILASLLHQQSPKALPPPVPNPESDDSGEPDPDGLRALDEAYRALKSPPVFPWRDTVELIKSKDLANTYVPCIAELERRKKQQEDKLSAYLAAHPEVPREGKPVPKGATGL